ncbi:hypothetical protein [Flavobacterium sp.]|uniref:hypothetical protein n=1 Tax=Flavobacterium sp. TaxID=239 RepID=UPI0025CDBFE3|nr:hypothetical protein [Flavobacterium sp.]
MKTFISILIILIFSTVQSQKTICFNEKGIKGIIFTKEYFANNKQSFSPSINDIREIEKQIKIKGENFSNYYRQYIGRNVAKKEIIAQLLPKSRIKSYHNWNKSYIYIQDDTEVRYIYYDLKTKKISIKPKESFGG